MNIEIHYAKSDGNDNKRKKRADFYVSNLNITSYYVCN